jgi:hypothetical protein
VLWLVARKMGRRSRIVSRALLAAFGPLDCSLVLSGSTAFDKLQRMLAGDSWQRLHQVKSLQLLGQLRFEVAEGGADLLAAIAAKLPHLESLALSMGPPDLSPLAPLRSTLTALEIQLPPHAFSTGDAGLSLLTNLRSLTFTGAPGGGDRVVWQHLLSSLPQLVRLNAPTSAWTPQWLAGLGGSMPQLTSLALGRSDPQQQQWAAVATAAAWQALTGLRSLSLSAMSLFESSTADSIMEGLSHCTWLDSLHLVLQVGPSEPPPNLLQLSCLRLASLDMQMVRAHAEPLEAVLHALTHLTKLRLAYHECAQDVGAPRLPSSLVNLQLLGDWNPSSLLPPLQALPSLRVLYLHHQRNGHNPHWGAVAAEQLSKLTQLHRLSIATICPRLLVFHLSALTTLRDLRLEVTASTEDEAADQDLLHLAALRALTRLALTRMPWVSALGLLALLEALPNLQQLELSEVAELEGGALVEGLLPRVLPRLACVNLVGVRLPGHVRAALLSAAEAHDCRCVV